MQHRRHGVGRLSFAMVLTTILTFAVCVTVNAASSPSSVTSPVDLGVPPITSQWPVDYQWAPRSSTDAVSHVARAPRPPVDRTTLLDGPDACATLINASFNASGVENGAAPRVLTHSVAAGNALELRGCDAADLWGVMFRVKMSPGAWLVVSGASRLQLAAFAADVPGRTQRLERVTIIVEGGSVVEAKGWLSGTARRTVAAVGIFSDDAVTGDGPSSEIGVAVTEASRVTAHCETTTSTAVCDVAAAAVVLASASAAVQGVRLSATGAGTLVSAASVVRGTGSDLPSSSARVSALAVGVWSTSTNASVSGSTFVSVTDGARVTAQGYRGVSVAGGFGLSESPAQLRLSGTLRVALLDAAVLLAARSFGGVGVAGIGVSNSASVEQPTGEASFQLHAAAVDTIVSVQCSRTGGGTTMNGVGILGLAAENRAAVTVSQLTASATNTTVRVRVSGDGNDHQNHGVGVLGIGTESRAQATSTGSVTVAINGTTVDIVAAGDAPRTSAALANFGIGALGLGARSEAQSTAAALLVVAWDSAIRVTVIEPSRDGSNLGVGVLGGLGARFVSQATAANVSLAVAYTTVTVAVLHEGECGSCLNTALGVLGGLGASEVNTVVTAGDVSGRVAHSSVFVATGKSSGDAITAVGILGGLAASASSARAVCRTVTMLVDTVSLAMVSFSAGGVGVLGLGADSTGVVATSDVFVSAHAFTTNYTAVVDMSGVAIIGVASRVSARATTGHFEVIAEGIDIKLLLIQDMHGIGILGVGAYASSRSLTRDLHISVSDSSLVATMALSSSTSASRSKMLGIGVLGIGAYASAEVSIGDVWVRSEDLSVSLTVGTMSSTENEQSGMGVLGLGASLPNAKINASSVAVHAARSQLMLSVASAGSGTHLRNGVGVLGAGAQDTAEVAALQLHSSADLCTITVSMLANTAVSMANRGVGVLGVGSQQRATVTISQTAVLDALGATVTVSIVAASAASQRGVGVLGVGTAEGSFAAVVLLSLRMADGASIFLESSDAIVGVGVVGIGVASEESALATMQQITACAANVQVSVLASNAVAANASTGLGVLGLASIGVGASIRVGRASFSVVSSSITAASGGGGGALPGEAVALVGVTAFDRASTRVSGASTFASCRTALAPNTSSGTRLAVVQEVSASCPSCSFDRNDTSSVAFPQCSDALLCAYELRLALRSSTMTVTRSASWGTASRRRSESQAPQRTPTLTPPRTRSDSRDGAPKQAVIAIALVTDTSQAVSTSAAVIASVSGSPGTAVYAARVAAVGAAAYCDDPESTPIDRTANPLGLTIGDGPMFQHYGTVVGGIVILGSLTLLHRGICLAFELTGKKTDDITGMELTRVKQRVAALTNGRFPSLLVLPASLLGPGVLQSALALVAFADNTIARLLGLCFIVVYGLCVARAAQLLLTWRFAAVFEPNVDREELSGATSNEDAGGGTSSRKQPAVEDGNFVAKVMRALTVICYTKGDWRNRRGVVRGSSSSGFRQRYMMLFCDYHDGARWFLLFEIGISTAVACAGAATAAPGSKDCVALSVVIAMLLCAHTLAVVVLRPHESLLAVGINTVVSGLQSASGIVAVSSARADANEDEDAAEHLQAVALYLSYASIVATLALTIYELWRLGVFLLNKVAKAKLEKLRSSGNRATWDGDIAMHDIPGAAPLLVVPHQDAEHDDVLKEQRTMDVADDDGYVERGAADVDEPEAVAAVVGVRGGRHPGRQYESASPPPRRRMGSTPGPNRRRRANDANNNSNAPPLTREERVRQLLRRGKDDPRQKRERTWTRAELQRAWDSLAMGLGRVVLDDTTFAPIIDGGEGYDPSLLLHRTHPKYWRVVPYDKPHPKPAAAAASPSAAAADDGVDGPSETAAGSPAGASGGERDALVPPDEQPADSTHHGRVSRKVAAADEQRRQQFKELGLERFDIDLL